MFAQLERILRIAAYSLVIALGATQLYTWLATNQQGAADRAKMVSSLIGRHVDVPEAEGKRSLVFALSTSCPYCSASAPFYQRLTTELTARPRLGVRSIAMFAEPTESATSYVSSVLRTKFDSVVQRVPEGLQATPTLLLVGSDGTVLNAWIGKLPADQEEKLIAAVQQQTQ